MEQLGNILTDKSCTNNHLTLAVDNESRLTLIVVGLQARASDPAEVVVNDLCVNAVLFGILRHDAHRSDLGVREGDLGNSAAIGGRNMGSPGCVRHWFAFRTCDDHVAGCTRLVLALVGE